MRVLLRDRFIALAIATLAAVAGLIALSGRSTVQLREDIADLDATRDAQALVQRVQASALKAQLAQDGQSLGADPQALETFEIARGQLLADLDRLITAPTTSSALGDELMALRGRLPAQRPAGRIRHLERRR